MRSLKCARNPEYIEALTCLMIPTKDGLYNVTIKGKAKKNVNEIWLHFIAYFLYQGEYRRFLIDFDWDYCGHFSGSITGFLLARAEKVVNSHYPGLIHPCPYVPSEGTIGVTNQSPTRVLNGAIPRAIPDGHYKLKVHVHTKTNETIGMVEATGNVTVLNKLKMDPSKLLAGFL